MAVRFTEVKVDDVLQLPGKVGTPDRYVVVFKNRDRVKLEKVSEKGNLKYHTDNQFDAEQYELPYDLPGKPVRFLGGQPEEKPEVEELNGPLIYRKANDQS